MLGMFLAFGVDTVVIVAALWYVGRLPGAVAGGVTAAMLGVFLLWVVGRWVRLRRRGGADVESGSGTAGDGTDAEADPVERLKRRYADGDISEREFERRLDRLLDAEDRVDGSEPASGSAAAGADRRGERDRSRGRR